MRAFAVSSVVIALAVLGVTQATAPAATGAGVCTKAAHAKGSSLVAANATAVVWHRLDKNRERHLYGCVHRDRIVRELPDEYGTFKLSGRWLAYVYAGSAIGDESDKIGLVNLHTGKNRRIAHIAPDSEGALDEIDNGGAIPAYAVAADGTLAWLTSAPFQSPGYDPKQLVLRVADGRPPAERIVDQGMIAATSLRLDAAATTVRYVKDGAAKSAPLNAGR